MKTNTSLLLGSVLLAVAVAGCGGGGGDSATPESPAEQQLADLQGFWSGALIGTPLLQAATTQAVVLPDGTAWFLLLPASGAPTGMVKATLAVSGDGYTGSGTVYDFTGGGSSTATLTGAASASSSLSSVFTVSGAAGTTSASTLAYNSAYATAALLSNVAGTWQVNASSAALHLDWVVQQDGTLAGTSSTGCTWTGAFTTRTPGTAVLDFTATEICASVPAVYSGIAVLDGAKTHVTLFVTTANDAQGLVLQMAAPQS